MEAVPLAKKALLHPRAIPSAIKKRLLPPDPRTYFHRDVYLRINARRLEHLASLELPLRERNVLEVGAGVGDLTSFFLDRGCTVITSEGRPENLAILRQRYPSVDARLLDLDKPDDRAFDVQAEVVFCYGLLYHLERPADALAFLARHCASLLLLETIVSLGEEIGSTHQPEKKHIPTEALSGVGSRPTRAWVVDELRHHFPYVYCTRTQPWHPEFPLDWSGAPTPHPSTRAVFIAAREILDNPFLTDEIPIYQDRHS
jgi:predicted RNA methylase